MANMYGWLRMVAVIAAFLATMLSCAPSARADIGAVIMRPPRYWSGTNCGFTGIVFTDTPGTHLTTASVRIESGGVIYTTRTYTADPNDPNPPTEWDGTLNFDSTHFPNGTSLRVRIIAQNNFGETDEGRFSVTANTYNRAFLFGNRSLNWADDAISNAEQHLTDMNHSWIGSMLAYKSWILEDMVAPSTVFYCWTHGHEGMFGDSYYTNNLDAQRILTAEEIANAVATKTADQPAYNFVFIDACRTAVGPALADAFGVNGPPDRAFLGWEGIVQDDFRAKEWSDKFWHSTSAGLSVVDAAFLAQQTWGLWWWKLYGDNAAKVHFVYQGAFQTDWYRPQ